MHGVRLNKKQEERRMNVVKDVMGGMDIKKAAERYDVSIFTLYKWLRIVERGGEDALRASPRKGSEKLSEEEKRKLVEILERGSREYGLNDDFWTLRLVAYVVEREFGVKYVPTSLSPVLRRMGFRCVKGRRVYRRDEGEVEGWVKEKGEYLFKKMNEGCAVHVFDESYISQANKGRGWMGVGHIVRLNPRRDRSSVIGGITISRDGISFSHSVVEKPSLTSRT
jgi:transposase